MDKITTFVMILSGLLLLFYFTGIITCECESGWNADRTMCADTTEEPSCSTTTKVLTWLLHPEAIANPIGLFNVWDIIIGAFTLALASGITILLWSSGKPDLAIMSGVLTSLAPMFFDLTAIFNKTRDVAGVHSMFISVLIFGPLMLMLMITLIDWWRSHD